MTAEFAINAKGGKESMLVTLTKQVIKRGFKVAIACDVSNVKRIKEQFTDEEQKALVFNTGG
jgi:hypothetical protein